MKCGDRALVPGPTDFVNSGFPEIATQNMEAAATWVISVTAANESAVTMVLQAIRSFSGH
jgi:hypothetical protein